MKITAGLGSVDDYLPYVEAGADEFFCGYVPYEWMKNDMQSHGLPFNEAEFVYCYDVPSFLSYYGQLLTFKGLARVTGVSAAQLSQYATGYRNPSRATTEKIERGVKALSEELAAVGFV